MTPRAPIRTTTSPISATTVGCSPCARSVDFSSLGLDLARVAARQRLLARSAPATALSTSVRLYWVGLSSDLARFGRPFGQRSFKLGDIRRGPHLRTRRGGQRHPHRPVDHQGRAGPGRLRRGRPRPQGLRVARSGVGSPRVPCHGRHHRRRRSDRGARLRAAPRRRCRRGRRLGRAGHPRHRELHDTVLDGVFVSDADVFAVGPRRPVRRPRRRGDGGLGPDPDQQRLRRRRRNGVRAGDRARSAGHVDRHPGAHGARC